MRAEGGVTSRDNSLWANSEFEFGVNPVFTL
jgi:hypothetical protein